MLSPLCGYLPSASGDPRIYADDKAAKCPADESDKGKGKDQAHEFAKIVGALSVNSALRKQFFGAKTPDAAKAILGGRGLTFQQAGVECMVEKMHAARSSPDNPVEKACESLNTVLSAMMPCPDWPC